MSSVVMEGDGTNDDTANCPEHLQHLRSWGSQFDGYDFTAVCGGVCNEDAPWYALEKLGHENKGKRLCKVKDEDKGIQEHETNQGGVTVSDAACEGTSEEDADKGTELARHLKGRLPLGDNYKLSGVSVEHTIFLLEGG
jgi:hypothetical protein